MDKNDKRANDGINLFIIHVLLCLNRRSREWRCNKSDFGL